MTVELPVGTRFIQIRNAAVAVTPDERVYLVRNGAAIELVPRRDSLAATDDTPSGVGSMPVSQLDEE
jgi:hypothetical protein